MTARLILAFVIAFFTATAVGRYYIPWLRKIKAGQTIKEIGPSWHMKSLAVPDAAERITGLVLELCK